MENDQWKMENASLKQKCDEDCSPSHLCTALLLANLFVGREPFESHTAVGGHSFNHRAAGTEIERDLLRSRP